MRWLPPKKVPRFAVLMLTGLCTFWILAMAVVKFQLSPGTFGPFDWGAYTDYFSGVTAWGLEYPVPVVETFLHALVLLGTVHALYDAEIVASTMLHHSYSLVVTYFVYAFLLAGALYLPPYRKRGAE